MANRLKVYEVHSALIFNLTKLAPMHFRIKRRCSKLLHNSVIISLQ